MIVRVWRGVVRRRDADAYEAYLRREALRQYGDVAGNQGGHMLRRPVGDDEDEFCMVTQWVSWDAVRAFTGDAAERAVFLPDDDRFLVSFDETVANYEVREDIVPTAPLRRIEASVPIVRPIALAVIRRGPDILVYEARDETKQQTFCRPLGGGIDFGETAIDAVRRELSEELGVSLTNVTQIGVLENIFTAFGGRGHEIAFMFDAEIADPDFYQRPDPGVVLDGHDPVLWCPLSRFADGTVPLYPDGLFELLSDRLTGQPEASPSTTHARADEP